MFSSFSSHICIACIFTVRDRSLGTDTSESDVGVIEEVPEDVIEPDQQQDQGKHLSISKPLQKSIFVNVS